MLATLSVLSSADSSASRSLPPNSPTGSAPGQPVETASVSSKSKTASRATLGATLGGVGSGLRCWLPAPPFSFAAFITGRALALDRLDKPRLLCRPRLCRRRRLLAVCQLGAPHTIQERLQKLPSKPRTNHRTQIRS
eukprot:scaffold91909_cov75-Phaeocystis_antarctica.AAC.6